MTQDRFVATPFWELFEMPFAEGAKPWEACRDVASRGGEFVVHGVRVAGKYERGSFTMRFRRAAGVSPEYCLRIQGLATRDLRPSQHGSGPGNPVPGRSYEHTLTSNLISS